MTKVLVAAASRHGSTKEIAIEIGAVLQETLRREGDDAFVEVRDADDVSSVSGYDAAVLGSAVYMDHWLDAARQLVASHMDALAEIPVWLFSSGPVGNPPLPRRDPIDIVPLCNAVRARGHRTFPGKLDRRALSLREKAVAVAVRAPEGDFRDWAALWTWTGDLSDALLANRVPS